jgi:hypothetical protein
MIPIKGDKKLFVHINYKITNSADTESELTKQYVNFIEVPKRFQIESEGDTVSTHENSDKEIIA